MIKQTIKIGSKDVDFACSAATLKWYSDEFGEDLFSQMSKLAKETPDLDVLEKLAYVMAKQAGETLSYLEWLDQFELIDFLQDLPKVVQLWTSNNKVTVRTKKK